MALLAVAYPELAPADYAWIQHIRKQHDAHYTLVEPHFTLIFPTSAFDQATFSAHVEACVQQARSFTFAIRCAMIVKDAFGPQTHLFLVPDEGYSACVKLHDALYAGTLASSLHLDVPFIPHITIGDHVDPQSMKVVADQINRQDICIRGQVRTIDMVRFEQNVVETIKIFHL